MKDSKLNPLFHELQQSNSLTLDLKDISMNCLNYFAQLVSGLISHDNKFCIGLFLKNDMDEWKSGPFLFSVSSFDPVEFNLAVEHLSDHIDTMIDNATPCSNGIFSHFIDFIEKRGNNAEYEMKTFDGYFCYDCGVINNNSEFVIFLHSSEKITNPCTMVLMNIMNYFTKTVMKVNTIHNRVSKESNVWKDNKYCNLYGPENGGTDLGQDELMP